MFFRRKRSQPAAVSRSTRAASPSMRCSTAPLCTNTRLTPLQAALRYRERWMVEDIFRTAKALLATRPIFHKYDETIVSAASRPLSRRVDEPVFFAGG